MLMMEKCNFKLIVRKGYENEDQLVQRSSNLYLLMVDDGHIMRPCGCLQTPSFGSAEGETKFACDKPPRRARDQHEPGFLFHERDLFYPLGEASLEWEVTT